MVFFSCDGCGEALKKNQVEKHTFRCRGATYSCIDCQKVFTHNSYAQHTKCITENQKYGGKNYVEKEAKGELKQNAWCEQVSRAIEFVKDSQVKSLLHSVEGFGNIPRKEAKFINFLMNSCKLRDRSLALRAWQAIAAEADKMREEATRKSEEAKKAKAETLALAASASKKDDEEAVEKSTVEESATKSFKWKATIKRKLKEAGGEMKVKKLRKEVLSEYAEKVGEDLNEDIFDEKLGKSGVTVDGKRAILA